MDNILTEDQLRAALIAGEAEDAVSIVPQNLAFCERCDHFFDTRAGCEADIRFDVRSKIREALLAQIESVTVSVVWPDDRGPGTKVEPFVLICDLSDAIDQVLPKPSDDGIEDGV